MTLRTRATIALAALSPSGAYAEPPANLPAKEGPAMVVTGTRAENLAGVLEEHPGREPGDARRAE